MTRRLFVAALATFCASLVAPGPHAAASPQRAHADASAFDAVVTKAFPATEPGAAIIVVRDGQVIYRKAAGMAHMELGVPLQPDTVFRLGSITKQFTAVAVMLLAQQGKLALTDPIGKHLAGYPTQGHTITIEHLLTHTSGIQSYTSMPGWMTGRVRNEMNVDELVDGFKREPMQFAPGERFEYNNSGYVLLGAIIEKVSGMSYDAFVRDRIFAPLGMTHSHYGSDAPIIQKRAQGYSRRDGQIVNAAFLSMTQPYAAGALVSSVDDLAKWDAALYTDALLPQAARETLWTPYTLRSGASTGYAYGWGVSTLRGHRVIEHGGGIFGFSTHALRLPDARVYVAVLCNSDQPPANPGYVARRLAAIAIGKPFPEPVAVTVDEAALASHVGVYEIDAQTRRTVTVENGTLYTQRSGGQRSPARPRSATEFFYDNSLTWLAFERDPRGRTVAMLMYQDGADTPVRAVRIADTVTAPPVARVDPATYDAYVGQYELGPGFILAITREGDQLMAQATGQAKFEIFPSSDTEFFVKVVDARITFVKGPSGRIEQLILHQGGRDVPGRRR